jgi:ABC-type glycerol-3-phosphate transport system substrate-binding protein
MSKFQIVLLGVFGVIIIISVILFSQYKGGGKTVANVVVWGSLPTQDFNNILTKTSLYNNKLFSITYVQKDKDTIDSDFVEALAAGGGPDLLLIPHQKIVKQKNKFIVIPYSAYSERTFKDSFIEGAEIYLSPEGIVALPVMVDPMVMYWNRSIFTNVSLTQPPKYWDEFYALTQAISKKDGALNISRSAVSLGEYANVTSAKEILSTLMMQAGTPIVDTSREPALSVLSATFDKPLSPAEAAVNFYTQFSNPAKPFYSWNRSLPRSSDYFLSGNLAMYFGFASELFDIQKKNPNINFDVAMMPSSREGGVDATFATFYALAISKGSKDPNGALSVALVLSSSEGSTAISDVLALPPVRRDLLTVKPSNPYKDVFYRSAIISKAWLDPSPTETNKIFQDMIESITSGRERASLAISKASRALGDLFRK